MSNLNDVPFEDEAFTKRLRFREKFLLDELSKAKSEKVIDMLNNELHILLDFNRLAIIYPTFKDLREVCEEKTKDETSSVTEMVVARYVLYEIDRAIGAPATV